MSLLAFMSLWQAVPFRPFRLRLTDGRCVDILDARQAAAAPDLQLLTVLGPGGQAIAFQPGLIAACEALDAPASPPPPPPAPTPPTSAPAVAPDPPAGLPADAVARLRAAGVDPAAIAAYAPDAGRVSTMTSTATDGAPLVHVAIADRDARPLLSTLGTRWSLLGMESFDNGRTLYLIHADDPRLQQRVIVWPPHKATLDTFAEAQSPAGVQRALADMDRAARAAPADLLPPADYFDAIKVPTPDLPPVPADRCRVETVASEQGPHRYVQELRVVDGAGKPLLDLTSCGWFGESERDGAYWRLQLARADDDYYLRVQVDPARRAARLDSGAWLPLPLFERVFRNSDLYADPDALRRALKAALEPGPAPEVAFPLPDGHVLELWPAPRDVPTPFLHPRLLAPSGRALLDFRGSPWGAIIEWPDHLRSLPPALAVPDAAFAMRLIHRDPRDRYDASRMRLGIQLAARRVVCPDPAGAAPLGVLHAAAHSCAVASLLPPRLGEALTRAGRPA